MEWNVQCVYTAESDWSSWFSNLSTPYQQSHILTSISLVIFDIMHESRPFVSKQHWKLVECRHLIFLIACHQDGPADNISIRVQSTPNKVRICCFKLEILDCGHIDWKRWFQFVPRRILILLHNTNSSLFILIFIATHQLTSSGVTVIPQNGRNLGFLEKKVP